MISSSDASMVVTIGIISIGDMGGGIARLLIAHKYRVITNVSDRRFGILGSLERGAYTDIRT